MRLIHHVYVLVLPANSVTLGWLSNNMSADLEDVHVPVKKAKPKQAKVITFWPDLRGRRSLRLADSSEPDRGVKMWLGVTEVLFQMFPVALAYTVCWRWSVSPNYRTEESQTVQPELCTAGVHVCLQNVLIMYICFNSLINCAALLILTK